MANISKQITKKVRAFYEDLPFNYYTSASYTHQRLQEGNAVENIYPDLHRLLISGEIRTVMDFGCGAGWLTNTIAYHYGLPVTAVDFTPKAVQRAREVAGMLNVADLVEVTEADLFEFTTKPVHLVACIGVLPCVYDAKAGFDHIQKSVASGKYVYLGLYHHYGRKVFLDMFQRIIERDGETAALEKYRRLDANRLKDETHLQSWFRDQVLHPHENHQTLQEVVGWFEENGFELLSTSINAFEPIDRLEDLFELEQGYEDISYQANYVEERYFPGFFTVLAQKRR